MAIVNGCPYLTSESTGMQDIIFCKRLLAKSRRSIFVSSAIPRAPSRKTTPQLNYWTLNLNHKLQMFIPASFPAARMGFVETNAYKTVTWSDTNEYVRCPTKLHPELGALPRR